MQEPNKIEIFRTKRRSLALHIRSDGQLVVRVPRHVDESQIHRFIRQHARWIEKTRQRIFEKKKLAEAWRAQFPLEDSQYKEQALPLFSERCELYAALMGVSYKKIGLSNAATRWGSCSPAGSLRFNWRLVMAPPEIVDYVVVHELAHLKELNHSKRFWVLVKAVAPHYRQAKKWLHQHPLGRFQPGGPLL